MEIALIPFDVTQYLDSEEAIAQYLTQVLEGTHPLHITPLKAS